MAPRRTIERARKLRRTMAPPEVRLWAIFLSRPDGPRVRRQHPIGPYVLDFYCPQPRLAIEVDGAAHDMGERPARDRLRDLWLAEHGIGTMRVSACDTMERPDAIVAAIAERCALPLRHPADGPPPHAAHGEDAG